MIILALFTAQHLWNNALTSSTNILIFSFSALIYFFLVGSCIAQEEQPNMVKSMNPLTHTELLSLFLLIYFFALNNFSFSWKCAFIFNSFMNCYYRCSYGWFGFPQKINGSCRMCECNPHGSVSDECHELSGQCNCKLGITGRDCSVCPPRHTLSNKGCVGKSLSSVFNVLFLLLIFLQIMSFF